MNLMIEQKENYSWVTQAGLHGLTLEGLELYKIEYFFLTKLLISILLLLFYIIKICQVNFLEIEQKSIL